MLTTVSELSEFPLPQVVHATLAGSWSSHWLQHRQTAQPLCSCHRLKYLSEVSPPESLRSVSVVLLSLPCIRQKIFNRCCFSFSVPSSSLGFSSRLFEVFEPGLKKSCLLKKYLAKSNELFRLLIISLFVHTLCFCCESFADLCFIGRVTIGLFVVEVYNTLSSPPRG